MGSRKKVSEEFIKFCPRCKSIDIQLDKSNPIQPAGGLPYFNICNTCGHTGFNFPECKVDQLNKFEDEVARKHLSLKEKDSSRLIDTSYGDFEVKVVWKFAGPILLILGAIGIKHASLYGLFIFLIGVYTTYKSYQMIRVFSKKK